MSFVSDIVGGVLGANAAKHAANAEETGAQKAQALEKTNQENALNFQNQVWSGTQQAEQPYQTLGSTSANSLTDLLSKGFQAPTLQDAENTPGYQFQLEQGTRAINQDAAANGTLLSGNTGTALENYGQNLAQTTYNNDYQNALSTYMANYNTLQGGTNTGLNSTAQLGQFGQSAAQNTSNIDLTGGDQQAQQINNAAAARASGYLGAAAGYSKAVGGAAGGFGNMDFSGGSSPLEMAGEFAGFL